jgi:hypothetical protein
MGRRKKKCGFWKMGQLKHKKEKIGHVAKMFWGGFGFGTNRTKRNRKKIETS